MSLSFWNRAWKHLREGGRFIVTEYGGENSYPVQAIQLNHEEFFNPLWTRKEMRDSNGIRGVRLVPLKNFLAAVNDRGFNPGWT